MSNITDLELTDKIVVIKESYAPYLPAEERVVQCKVGFGTCPSAIGTKIGAVQICLKGEPFQTRREHIERLATDEEIEKAKSYERDPNRPMAQKEVDGRFKDIAETLLGLSETLRKCIKKPENKTVVVPMNTARDICFSLVDTVQAVQNYVNDLISRGVEK